ncbi:hypothetical protein KCU77_g151, partial [Aureobasidium melanogenum]
MCLPVCRHSCFVFGVLINLLLLALTIYCADSGKPFAVWVSLLIAFLLAFVFVVTITLGHLRYEPARRGSSSYIVPLNDEEIELYHIGSSPLSTVNEEPSEEEMYRRHLAERPLPPEPAHRRRRSGRGSPFPTLISPLSDPFIEQDTRLPAQHGRNTIRLVPESSRLLQIKKSRPPYIMFLKDALACMRLPSFSAMGSCCKRLYLLCLCAFIISMLLGTTTWANINFNTTKALIPLIVATILPSMIEGVLVLAIIKAINNKPLDCESHDPPLHLGCTAPSDPAGPLDQALIHPAFRDYSEGSLNSTRNFSLPRERCLDVMPACNAPASPIPRPYLATDTISRIMNTHRPLPPLPFEPNNAPTPPPHLEVVSDVTIFPLCIQKRDSATSETAVKRSEDVVNIKSDEVLESKPARFNSGPGYPSSMSEAEKIIIGLASEQDIQEVDPKEAYYARERIYNEEGLTKKSRGEWSQFYEGKNKERNWLMPGRYDENKRMPFDGNNKMP